VAQRLVLLIGTLIGVLTVTFVLTHILPGSPVEVMLGHQPTQEQIAAARHALGLDLPLWKQYLRFVVEIARGQFGQSFLTNQPVIRDISQRLPATVELASLAMISLVLFGVPIGVLCAVNANSPVDHLLRGISTGSVALPGFMLAMLLQIVFYGRLGWLPVQGRMSSVILLDHQFPRVTGLFLVDTLLAGDTVAFKDAAQHIILPVTTLTLISLPLVARTTRNMMVEQLTEDYVRTALAYGLPPRNIHFRYALAGTLIPLLTTMGLTFGTLIGGTVVIEYVYDWPGIGSYIVRAITQSDYPAAIGVTVFLATAYLVINIIVDLLYFLVDPRLRLS
jgi:peptide/nickel transport system permease protein